MPRGSHRIRQTRKELGWSQLQLAVRAGVAPRTVQFAEAGEANLSHSKLSQIAQTLGLEFCEASKPGEEEIIEDDQFAALPWSATHWIRKKMRPGVEAFCDDASDVKEILSVMRENWRNHLDRGDPNDPTKEETFYQADEKLNESYFRYEQRYLSIWNCNPLTLMLATTNGVRTGASITLPVTDAAYERLRDGQINFMEIGAEDICEESQNLILDHAVEFPVKQNLSWYRLTDSLSYTVFCQIAMLASDPSLDDFRMLSFGASPINMRRLANAGFHENGVLMPEFNYPICEFYVADSQDDLQEYSTTSTWAHFSHLVKRFAPKVDKQRVIKTTLRALQKAIKTPVSSKSSAA